MRGGKKTYDNNIKEIEMKTRVSKTILALAALLWVPAGGRVSAQSYTKSTYNMFNNLSPSDSVISRSWNDTALFTCSHLVSPVGGETHLFTMHSSQSASSVVVGMPVYITQYGVAIRDRVYDMRILGNTCYFCGSRIKPTGMETYYTPEGNAYTVYTYDTCGLMGYYTFDNTLTPTSAIAAHEIAGVRSALRMAVFPATTQGLTGMELLCAYGPDGHTNCLAELCNTLTNPDIWAYRLTAPSDTNEVLTDVTVTDSYLVTASVFKNDESLVGYRYAKKGEFAFGDTRPYSTADELYLYNIGSYTSAYFPQGIRRVAGAPVRLCPNWDGFVSGFAGYPFFKQEPGSMQILRNDCVVLFDMEHPGYMREFQAAQTGLGLKLKEVTSLTAKNAVGILYWSRPYVPGIGNTYLQFPRWGAVAVNNHYYDTLMHWDPNDIHSIWTYRGHSVTLGGTKTTTLVPFDGVQRQHNRTNSCYSLQGAEVIYREPVILPSLETVPWVVLIGNDETDKSVMEFTTSYSHATRCAH